MMPICDVDKMKENAQVKSVKYFDVEGSASRQTKVDMGWGYKEGPKY